MKICYLADGESIHTKRWCQHFGGLGHHVFLLSFKDVDIDGVDVFFVDTGNVKPEGGNWKVLLKVNKVRSILKKIKPDILHAQYATSYGIMGSLTGFHPYVITALGTDVLISVKDSAIYYFLVKYALSKADWVTAMADHMHEAILKMGTYPEKVDTVIFGIDPEVFNHKKRSLPDDSFVITSTRNFEPVYNLKLLIKALQIINSKIENFHVNLIGDGSLREELENLVKKYNLTQKIKFTGKVSQTQIAHVLNKSHLFVTVSFSDGNNISLNEAMACGTVALASDIPANHKWISEGINGYIVPVDNPQYLANKILDVYNNYESIAIKAIEFNDKIIAEKAIWANNMAKVEEKYNLLIGEKK